MNASDEGCSSPTESHDRRSFLRRTGLGAVAVGAWVAPQVLSSTSVSADDCGTPITKLLQIDASSCPAVGEPTDVDPGLPGCVPSGWASHRNDGVTFTYDFCVNDAGATINITSVGCTPAEAVAVKFCPEASGTTKYFCIAGVITGNTVTFPVLTDVPQCFYLTYRIRLTCC